MACAEEAGSDGAVCPPCLQLAPFPFDLMLRELRRYPKAQLMWVQEEPLNMGAFQHVSHRIETCMRAEVRAGFRAFRV
jgi:2-oxoglutarate dehydrogenase E1 component